MKTINKQKFLAELGRLLTFMYEEDRLAALEAYESMFQQAGDEQALLQFLVSPTRQAVTLARSYDSKDRTLQVHSQSREQAAYAGDQGLEAGELPPFLMAVEDLRLQAERLGVFSPYAPYQEEEQPESAPVDENQFSLFEDGPEIQEEQPAAVPEPEAEAEVPEAPAEAAVEEPVPTEPSEGEAVETAPVKEETEDGPDAVEAFADAVDAFLADFSITGDKLIAKEEAPEAEPQEASTETEAEPEPVQEEGIVLPMPEPVADPEAPEEDEPEEEKAPIEEGPVETKRKAKVGLLILYVLLAVPLGLVGTALLLIPTLVCLLVAVCLVSAGVLVLTAAFGGFTIFADLMVVVGLSLILLALGLLFTWLFIWFIGGAIVGLIRSLIDLGGKWCYKEVAAG